MSSWGGGGTMVVSANLFSFSSLAMAQAEIMRGITGSVVE